MSKRHASTVFPSLIILYLLALSSSWALGASPAGGDSPNIVLAFADDLGRYASAYADPDHPSPNDLIETKNFDHVAREGALFDNAFVSSPSCTPSRAALVSCRHFFRNGSHSQLHHPWKKGFPDPFDEVRGFPLILQDAGYHIGWSYKMHIYEDRMGGKKRNYISAGQRFNKYSQNLSSASDPVAEKQQLLDEVRNNFGAFLKDRKPDEPFFYWFNPTNTHRDWVQGSGKKLWNIDPDKLRGRLASFLPDNPIVREDFSDYLGEALAFDASVGVLIEELKSRGEWENTIFVISGDHGAPGFPRGKCNLYDFGSRVPLAIRWPEGIAAGRRIRSPVSLIDLGPTFLDAAKLKPTDDMDGESLLGVIRKEDPRTERDLRGYAIFGRENHVNESRPGGLPYPMRAIRTKDYLFITNFEPDRWPVAEPPLSAPLSTDKGSNASRRRMDIDFGPTRSFFVEFEGSESIAREWELGFGKRPKEELYEIASDVDQIHNLADDPDFASVCDQLKKQLFAELKKGKDPRVMGSGDSFDKPPYAPGNPDRGKVKKSSDNVDGGI